MKIAVVDDCKKERSELLNFLSTYVAELQIAVDIDTFETGDDFLSKIELHTFDLVFLDIYMDGTNGMEVARKIREYGFQGLILFSTVSTDHAVSGYSVQAFDYLVKPYDYSHFKTAMNRCMKELSHKQLYITVKESRTYIKVLLDDILFTDYYNHYIQIHTAQRMIKSHMRFADFYKLLEPYPQFLNCYRNCIINMDYVSVLKGYEFILKSGDIMPITRNQRTAIKQAYADYEFFRLKKGVI